MDPNPLVRALAIRTMGCIRVDKITEYLCEPLRNALKVKQLGKRLTELRIKIRMCEKQPPHALQSYSTSTHHCVWNKAF
jgi:hypothetical protein